MRAEQQAFEEWKQADAQARALNVLLSMTWQRVMDRTGAPPSEEMLREVSRLRAFANEKLAVLMVLLGARPSSLAVAQSHQEPFDR